MTHDKDRPESPARVPEYSSTHGPVPAPLAPADGLATLGFRASGPALPPGLSYTPNLPVLLKSLQRRWFLGTMLGILAGAVAMLSVWYLMWYHEEAVAATTTILLNPIKPYFLVPDKGDDYVKFANDQLQLIQSPGVVRAALRKPGIAELSIVKANEADTATWLQSTVSIELAAPWMLVKLVSKDKDKASELELLVRALGEAYLDEARVSEEKSLQDRLQNFRNRRDIELGKLQRFRKAREAYDAARAEAAKKPDTITESGGRYPQRLIDAFFGPEREKTLLEIARKDLDKEYLKIQASRISSFGPHKATPEEIEEKLAQDPEVVETVSQIADLKGELLPRANFYKEGLKHPIFRDELEQIESWEATLLNYRAERRQTIKEELEGLPLSEIQNQITKLDEEIRELEEHYKICEEQINTLNKQIQVEPGKAGPFPAPLDLEDLDDRILAQKQKVDRITQPIIDLELESGQPPRVEWSYDVTVVPEVLEPVQAQLFKLAGISGAGALALVLLIVAYLEFLAKRVHTSDDVVYGLGWRVVGALPALPNGKSGFLSRRDEKYWQSLLTESVDATRTTLLHAARTEGLRTVMVTSAVSGEGKTSLSCHLAFSLARAGRKTLLIDCDLRSPAAHRLFDLGVTPGFSEVLRGEIPLQDVIQETPANNLYLIAAGECDSQTLQALAHDGLPPVLDRLKEQFDFIVIDSSPVLPVVDALVIGQHVDVVIFSLLRGVSRIPNIYAAYQRLATLGIRMLGAVVNGVKRNSYGDSYHYYAKQPK